MSDDETPDGSDADGAGGPAIRALDEATVRQIAAGEVVERPASAVKELVENSLDADASRIAVAVERGGIDGLRVRDDGVGMTAAELELAVEEHTTSKIGGLDDLDAGVGTLGFRGEALYTIGAVSTLTVRSKPRGSAGAGHELTVEAGDAGEVRPAGCPEGTTVEVENLFANTPARRKFLKSEATEFDHVNAVVTQYALANPDVAVSLDHDGREVFATEGRGSLESAVLSVYGREVAESMVDVGRETGDADRGADGAHSGTASGSGAASDRGTAPVESVSGLVSHPETTRAGREYVSTFVNGRYVTASVLREAVLDAYGGQLAPDRYPFAVLFVEVPPDSVDVNVHPRKLEVRFDDEPAVKRAVTGAVESALLDHGLLRSTAPRGRSAPDEATVDPARDSEDVVGGARRGTGAGADGRSESGSGSRSSTPTNDSTAESSAPSPSGGGATDGDAASPQSSTSGSSASNAGSDASESDAPASDAEGAGDSDSGTSTPTDPDGSEIGVDRPGHDPWSVDVGPSERSSTRPGTGDREGAGDTSRGGSNGAGESGAGESADAAADPARRSEPSPPTDPSIDRSTRDGRQSSLGPSAGDGGGDDRSDAGPAEPVAPGGRPFGVAGPTEQRGLDGELVDDVALDSLPPMRVLGQLYDTYVVAETDDGLVLVDQHAADERVNYERLRREVLGDSDSDPESESDSGSDAQALANPVALELTAREAALFEEYAPHLAALGFEAERVDSRRVEVRSVPAVFASALDPELLRDALSAFVADEGAGGRDAVESVADALLADLACYPSVTGNTSLTEGSVVELLEALDACENPYACPHGRPVVIRFPREEIEDRFERDYPGHGGRRAE